jgi:hypothetical protein
MAGLLDGRHRIRDKKSPSYCQIQETKVSLNTQFTQDTSNLQLACKVFLSAHDGADFDSHSRCLDREAQRDTSRLRMSIR